MAAWLWLLAAALASNAACARDVLTPPIASEAVPDSVQRLIAEVDALSADVAMQVREMEARTEPADRVEALTKYATKLAETATSLRASAVTPALGRPSFTEYPEYEPNDPGIGVALPQTSTDVSISQGRLKVESAWLLPGILSHSTSLAYNVSGLAMNHTYNYKPTSIPIWWLPMEWPLPSRLNCVNDDAAADAQTVHSWEARIKNVGGSTLKMKHTQDFDSCQWQPGSVVIDVGSVDLRNGVSTPITVAVRKKNGTAVTDCPIRYGSSPAEAFSVSNGEVTAITPGPMYGYVTATCRGVYDAQVIRIHEDCTQDQNLVPLFTCGTDGTSGGGGSTQSPDNGSSGGWAEVCWPTYRWTAVYYTGYPEATTWKFEYTGTTCMMQWVESHMSPPLTAAASVIATGPGARPTPPAQTGRRIRLVRKDSLPEGAPIAVIPRFEMGEDLLLVASHATRSDLALGLVYADSILAHAPAASQQAHVLRVVKEAKVHGYWDAIAGAFMQELAAGSVEAKGRLAGRRTAVVTIPARRTARSH